MIRSLVLGTILSGLAAFLWSSVSWEVIGWHEKTIRTFQNEDEVSAMIAPHPTQSGTFLLPAGPSQEKQGSPIGLDGENAERTGGVCGHPAERFGLFTRDLVTQALIQTASALLLTWLLLQTSGSSYARRVLFLTVAGLAASVIADLPNWNGWGLSGPYAGRPHRLYNHLVSRGFGDRQSGKAANRCVCGKTLLVVFILCQLGPLATVRHSCAGGSQAPFCEVHFEKETLCPGVSSPRHCSSLAS